MPGPADARDDHALEALRALIRIPTVSLREGSDPASFDALLTELEQRFPRLHAELDLTRIGTHGLLFHWRGESADRPVVLMAHLDVVPVDADSPWQHDAFGGEIHDGAVWGRGTLDDKGCVAAICSAVERHLEAGTTPAQDVWLSFGNDEEVFGTAAEQAVAELEQRGVTPWFVIDEGGAVAHQAFPGVSAPVAVIGVAEKGSCSLELSAEGRGGHASMPAAKGPTYRIARAITRLEKAPFPATLNAPTTALLERMAPHASRALRPVLANAGRFPKVTVRALIAGGPESAAMTRTTLVATTLSASPAVNVIASRATAGLNIRIAPGESVDSVVDHVRRAIADKQVAIRVLEGGDPSPVSVFDDEAFALLEDTVGEIFPDAVASPYVLMAATDSRHFARICERVFRFAPFRMSKAQRQAIHSYDEHLGVDDYLDGVRWYHRLIERLPR